MEAGTKRKAHVEAKNGRALVNARPIPSVLGDARDELQQGAARILIDPPLPLGFFRGDAQLDEVVVAIMDILHGMFPFQSATGMSREEKLCRGRRAFHFINSLFSRSPIPEKGDRAEKTRFRSAYWRL